MTSPTPQWLKRIIPLFTSGLSAVILSACVGTTEPPPPVSKSTSAAPPATPAPSKTAKPSTPASPTPTKRGGGYYKDDGPDQNPPDNLDTIPDAEPRNEPVFAASTRPYIALGQSYTPMKARAPFVQEGVASWYGKKFHGAKTSTGEAYDMYAMTAAHPTLPLPSYVRVTNLENGRSVIVRVNDRGPFHNNRIIDLSYTAAWKLDYINKGSTRVKVETILIDANTAVYAAKVDKPSPAPEKVIPTPNKAAIDTRETQEAIALFQDSPPSIAALTDSPLTPPIPERGIFLQLGVFSTDRNAQSFREYLQTELAWLRQNPSETLHVLNEQGSYRLHLGPFNNTELARSTAERITQSIKLKPLVVRK